MVAPVSGALIRCDQSTTVALTQNQTLSVPIPSNRSVQVYQAISPSFIKNVGACAIATTAETSLWNKLFKRGTQPEESTARYCEAKRYQVSHCKSCVKGCVQFAAVVSSIAILAKWGAAMWGAIAAGTIATGGLLLPILVVSATAILVGAFISAALNKQLELAPHWSNSNFLTRFFGIDFINDKKELDLYIERTRSDLKEKISIFSNKLEVGKLKDRLSARISLETDTVKKKQLNDALEELRKISDYFSTRTLSLQA